MVKQSVMYNEDTKHIVLRVGQNACATVVFLLISMIDHHGELKPATNSFNPNVTGIQCLRMHLSLILAAVSKPIN